MKSNKVAFVALGAFVFIAAAVTAIYFFRNEIADFFVDIKARITKNFLETKTNTSNNFIQKTGSKESVFFSVVLCYCDIIFSLFKRGDCNGYYEI